MTTPTQAQIEAAAIKIAEIIGGPYAEGDSRNYIDAAKAALTAAAQVEEPMHWKMQQAFTEADRRATIERCAQVVRELAKNLPLHVHTLSEAAAAIRKLKDAPPVDPNIVHPGKDPDFTFPEEQP